MTGINHVMTGAVLASAIPSPTLAVGAAFVSHFVLDIFPHFGGKKIKATSLLNSLVLLTDVCLVIGFIVLMIVSQNEIANLLLLAGLSALLPDLMWFPNYFRELFGRARHPYKGFAAWHKKIQWAEQPWGIVVELVWLAGIGYLLLSKI